MCDEEVGVRGNDDERKLGGRVGRRIVEGADDVDGISRVEVGFRPVVPENDGPTLIARLDTNHQVLRVLFNAEVKRQYVC
jgi:hypothetical protein